MSNKPLRQQFADTMLAVGQEDQDLVVMVGDISHFALQPFAEACPGRYYNVGICEPTIISMAAGLSKLGLKPVVHTIAPFIVERGYEQIKLDFCYHRLGGSLISVGGVFDYSNLGVTHHCYGDWGLLKLLPNTEIIAPASAMELDLLFRQTYRNDRLTLFRLAGTPHGQEIDRGDITLGKAVRMTEGKDLTIIGAGAQLASAMAARELLMTDGWQVEVLYVHCIRPLDHEQIVNSVSKTGRVLVVEEHMQSGGLGDDVLRVVHQLPNARFSSLAIPDRFVTDYGSYQHHCESLGLTGEGIAAKVRDEFGPRPPK